MPDSMPGSTGDTGPTGDANGRPRDSRNGRARNVTGARHSTRGTGPVAGAFLLVAAAHLIALAADHGLIAAVTKPLPILLLAAYAVAVAKSRLLVMALVCSAVADVAIDLPGGFLVGMALFAAAHGWYIASFVGAGVRPRRALIAPYIAFWSSLLTQLWPDLGRLRVPVALYSLLLVATAALSAGHSPRAGAGGVLFLLSDVLIATRLAGWEQLPHAELLVMATYYLGQFMLTTGGPDRRP